jgi:large subunit ribosomal protein L9
MRIILREDVPNLGVVGDLVTVRDGYARNFLIPEGKASFASVKSIRELDHQKRLAAHQRKKATAAANIAKDRIESLSVVLQAKVAPPLLGDDGMPVHELVQRLFGSITNRDIAHILKDSGVEIGGHRRITVSEHVRTVGKYEAAIRLDGGIIANLPFWVIPEGATDIESEKRRVEEAQVKAREEEKRVIAEEQAKQAALVAEAEAAAKARAEAAAAASAEPAEEKTEEE